MRVAWIVLVAGCGFQSPAPDPDMGGAAAAPPDSGFDYATCPPSYNALLPGPTRYRLIPTPGAAWAHSDTCAADLPGATHLVVLETMPELVSVSGFVDTATTAGNAVWVGGVQLRTALLPRDGWLRFDGMPLVDGWASGEPNDNGGTENQEEQFVYLERGRRYLADRAGATGNGALCECDGKPVAATAAAAIVANRPPI